MHEEEDKTFAVVELENKVFRCILSTWIKKADDTNKELHTNCRLPNLTEKLILNAIHEHRKPNATWQNYSIIEIHRYAGNVLIYRNA